MLKKRLSEEFLNKHGFKQQLLYVYHLSDQKKSDRVRFVYLLKGRGGSDKGTIERLNGHFLTPGCFILPADKENEMQDIFRKWNIRHSKKFILTD